MKTPITLLLIILFLSFNSCSKEDGCENPIDCLPPITQNGAGTFGCLINGEPFIDTSGRFNCYYQLVNGEYNFFIGGEDRIGNLIELNISTTEKEILEGESYKLLENNKGNVWAGGFFSDMEDDGNFTTTDLNNTGTLTITKLDLQNRIISAEFEFELVDPYTNKILKITNGRFDSLFTR